MKYDLEERTARFGEKVIEFIKFLPKDDLTRTLCLQLLRSATSVGANYIEANQSSSKKDFKNKIHIARKESAESKHWFRMLTKLHPDKENEIKILWEEAHQLTLILSKIARSSD